MVFKPTCSHYGVEGDAHTNLGELGSAARAVVGAVMAVTHCDNSTAFKVGNSSQKELNFAKGGAKVTLYRRDHTV